MASKIEDAKDSYQVYAYLSHEMSKMLLDSNTIWLSIDKLLKEELGERYHQSPDSHSSSVSDKMQRLKSNAQRICDLFDDVEEQVLGHPNPLKSLFKSEP